MAAVPNHDHQPAREPELAPTPGSVGLVRFTIPPGRRSDLVRGMQTPGAGSASPLPDTTLLVELEDGDWLAISISRGSAAADAAADLDLDVADGIVGDETGVIVASSALRAP